MDERKVTASRTIRFRRTVEVHEFALAALSPMIHSSEAADLKRVEPAPPVIVVPPRRGGQPHDLKPIKSAAKRREQALGPIKAVDRALPK
jgi:hypothetical protein